ncbi:rho GTPase-activating protein 190 isoform X2 [Arctopsyche grandis]|uniref:rho GTPase-activating protein 190 isoform X2 n=1 Tax=Arctopsyche grandis TaxID=121162 RepID=UPI00406D888B
MMARKGDSSGRMLTVSVVGLSGTEKEKGQLGVGKSCLCNRFVRSKADDYTTEHISVLSQTDFSGRVVNNDHFLYWGSVNKELEDQEIGFQIVEQTEFVDDACFQPFKAGGKTEPYSKRCASLRLQSAEKLMYVCKNQLGIEKEYEQRLLPDGRLSIDGFICVYDVSHVPGRSWEKQSELVAGILNNIIKTKKPVILVTTKNDEAAERGVREAERLLGSRREWRAAIPIIETSSHLGVNIDHAFLLLSQMIDRSKNRIKISSYQEALRVRREQLDTVTEAFQHLIRAHITDHRETWVMATRRLGNRAEWLALIDTLGEDALRRTLSRHARALRDSKLETRLRKHLAHLPAALRGLRLDTHHLHESDWSRVVRQIRSHPDANCFFLESDAPWTEDALSGGSDDDDEDDQEIDEERDGEKALIPFDVLDTTEAANVFRTYLQDSQQEQRTLEWGRQFKQLLEETGYVTPGKRLSEVRVLFLGRECFEALSDREQNAIYDQHQKDLHQTAKHNFQELLLEHADLFYHLKSISPSGTITQEDIKEITDVLQDDFRYKILDKAEQDRKLVLFQHLGFVHCPLREHCPALPNCVDNTVPTALERTLGSMTGDGQEGSEWDFDPDNDNLNLLILGSPVVAEEVARRIETGSNGRASCRTATALDHHIPNFRPNGCFWVYWDQESFEHVREAVERSLLSNLEQDDHTQNNQGLPMVIMLVQQPGISEQEIRQLQDEGQSLSENVHWAYWECSAEELGTANGTTNALRRLPRARPARNQPSRPLADCFHADIRIILCLFCGDPYSVENVLGPLLLHPSCCLTGTSSILIDTFLGDSKRNIEVIVSSYHGANQFRDELIHGFVLVYSAKRKASLATLNAFSMNIPNLPIQVVAVAEGAGAFFVSELSQMLLTEGNAAADRLAAHFCTYTPSCHNNSAFYTPFFKEVWEKKAEIERAFHLEEEPGVGGVGGLPDVAESRPRPPPRADSYHLNHRSEGYQLPSSLDLLLGSQPDNNSMIHRSSFAKGFSVYPPPSTPPEPAPPDHRMPPADLSHTGGGGWGMMGARSATTGRPRAPPAPRHRHAHTLKQPGKLEMSSYALVSGALQQMSLRPRPPPVRKAHHGSTQGHHGKSTFGHHHHPSGVSSETELDAQYAQIKDSNASERMLGLAIDAQHARSKLRHRREKGQPSFSETDSECSSVEEEIGRGLRRGGGSSSGSGSTQRSKQHHKPYRKRLVAVAAPRAPRLGVFVGPPELPSGYRAREQGKEESSDGSAGEGGPPTRVGAYNLLHNAPSSAPYTSCDLDDQLSSCKESSAQENDSGAGHTGRSRRSGWPRLDRGHHKEWTKSKDTKKNSSQNAVVNNPGWGPQGNNGVPVFLEKCISFIEAEGLAAEGIYRVPGNRAHVDLLFKKFDEDPSVVIQQLDIPVNAVATALKEFFSKRLPPLFDDETMQELEDIAGSLGATDRSGRLLALRALLAERLPLHQRAVLKFIFHHFVRIADNSKLNSMDSKNLAICWWPTLLPVQFSDMARFEATRPYLEDILQTMIDQFPFLFCGQEAAVMV